MATYKFYSGTLAADLPINADVDLDIELDLDFKP